MSDETRDPIAAIVREAMDYAADHGRITTPEDYADRIRETLATPAAGEDVRQRVRQAVEWGIEDAWPRYNRIYDPHDPDDESRQEWVDCITEQVVTALLRTPVAPVDEDVRTRLREKLEAWIAEDRPGVVRPPFPLYLDDARTVAVLLRTPSGEGEAGVDEDVHDLADRLQIAAEKLDANGGFWIESGDDFADQVVMDMQEAARALRATALRSEAPGEMEIDEAALEEARAVLEDVRDALEVLPPGILGEASEAVEASDGEVGVRSWTIRDELIDRINRALRSEWKIDEPAREIARREMSDTRATVREVAADARRGEGGGE